MKRIYIALVCVLMAVTVLWTNKMRESMTNTEKKNIAFCILTRSPNLIWMEFIVTFQSRYEVYVCVDDNDLDLSELRGQFPAVRFLQYEDAVCAKAGFRKSSTAMIKKPVIAWDKALYHFCEVDTQYDHVWFCEDDVYIEKVDNVAHMDDEDASASDLLCSNLRINTEGVKKGWMWWKLFPGRFEPPWAGTLVVIVRMSHKLLREVGRFVKQNGELMFIECLFGTVAVQNDMEISEPEAMKLLKTGKREPDESTYSDYLIHPIKDLEEHVLFRG